ncbi:hypothetical protein CR513_36566, partial [Mucuna pruriens]
MVTMFIETRSSPYYDKVVGSVASNFADLMVVGERIELGIRHGKLAQANSNWALLRSSRQRKRKAKPTSPSYPVQLHVEAGSMAAHASLPPMSYVPPYQPRVDARVAVTLGSAQQGARRPPRMLTPIPMTYTKLLP